jgi:hypothetical protein
MLIKLYQKKLYVIALKFYMFICKVWLDISYIVATHMEVLNTGVILWVNAGTNFLPNPNPNGPSDKPRSICPTLPQLKYLYNCCLLHMLLLTACVLPVSIYGNFTGCHFRSSTTKISWLSPYNMEIPQTARQRNNLLHKI